MNSAVNLRYKAISSLKWTGFYSVFNVLITPLYRIFLAQLFNPTDFAYIAVVYLFISGAKLVGNLGLAEAIIQKENTNIKERSSLFCFTLVISTIISVGIYLGSDFVEDFYGLKGLHHYLNLISIAVLLNGISNFFHVFLRKNLFFKQITIINIIRYFLDLGLSIYFILLGYGIEGFIWGTIISTFFYMVILISVASKKAVLVITAYFSYKDLKPFLKFGIFVSSKQIFTFITQHVDEIIIGRFLSSEVLGIYYFGKDLMHKPQTLITQSFAQVLFTVFSKIKSNLPRLRKVYMYTSNCIALLAFPLFLGLIITAHLFIPIVFGVEWVPSVGVIRVFALTGIFLVLTANVATSLLYTIGKPNLVLYIDVITNSFYFLSLFLFAFRGLNAILILYFSYILYKTIVLQIFVSKRLHCSIVQYFIGFKNIFLSSVIMVLVIIVIQHIFSALPELYLLIISIVIGILVYVILICFLQKDIVKQIICLILNKGKIEDEQI